jgi:UDP-N-acetylmuramoyl-tripeptide--D-alanyl-D-alanine ligase
MSFTSKQLARAVGGTLYGDGEIVCNGAEIDTREPIGGKVFFALQGENADGFDYINDAISGGCSAVVSQRYCDVEVPIIVVPNSRVALYALAKYRREEMQLALVFGVTGSVGKTTTKDILSCLLGEDVVSSKKSFNNDLGVPLTLLAGEEASYLVAEVGANGVGEIAPLAELVQPDVAILTSIDKAHLAGFNNMATVLQEKAKLLLAVHQRGIVVVPDTIDVSGVNIQATIVTVGSSENADVRIETSVDTNGFATLSMEGCTITLGLLGEHNARNAALAVVAVARALPSRTTKSLLAKATEVSAPDGRLQRVEVDGVTFLNDSYNANPASMQAALCFFHKMQAKRKVLVLGDMLELGECAHAEHRAIICSLSEVECDVVVLVGQAMSDASDGFPAICIDGDDPLDSVASLLEEGDLVLLKGSRGMQLERIVDLFRQTKVLEH